MGLNHDPDESNVTTIRDPATGIEAKVVTDDFGVARMQVDANVNSEVFGDRFILNLLNTSSADMDVDGSSTPVVFELPLNVNTRIVRVIAFYGRDNGIQYDSFLALSTLDTGIGVQIKSNDTTFSLPNIQTTDDFVDKFSFFTIQFFNR